MIPYGRQLIDDDDIYAVIETLKSDYLTQGPAIFQFEDAITKYVNSQYAIAVCNATAALHLSCIALGLSNNDELWTSPISFVASSNCGLYCGAKVDFVDVDDKTYNLCPNKLEDKLKKGKRPKIVIPVHFSGQSCDMQSIRYLADKYNFFIIEDASHSIGATYNEKRVGCCEYSDISVFSFHPVKIITTGEGGVITTNQQELAVKLNLLRSHGITRDRSLMETDDGPWYYEQTLLGYNYRMTDIQAALGRSQLKKVNEFVERRREIASFYDTNLSQEKVLIPYQSLNQKSSYHLYVIQANKRDSLYRELYEAGIGVNVHYIPIHLQPYYAKLGFKMGDFPVAEKYYEKCISLPLHPGMTESDAAYIKDKVNLLS